MTTRLASFESFVTLILTLLVLFQTSVKNWFSMIWNNERLAFLLVYSLSTAVVIGYTAQNFGTLSRYKSLLLPFYFCALILFYLESKKAKTPNPINPKTNQPIH